MKLDEIDTAVKLRNHRQNAIKMRSATCGYLEIWFTYEGFRYDPATVIDVGCVRNAVAHACDAFIAEKEAELRALGVEITDESAKGRVG